MTGRRGLVAATAVLVAIGVGVGVTLALTLTLTDGPKADAGTSPGGMTNAAHVTATLAWNGRPRTIAVDGLSRDRILAGELRNASSRPADLAAEHVRVLDTRGRLLLSTARFAWAFAHGLYSPEAQDLHGRPGASERRRLGEIATVRRGQVVPITLSWRLYDAGIPAAKVEFGGRAVTLPVAR